MIKTQDNEKEAEFTIKRLKLESENMKQNYETQIKNKYKEIESLKSFIKELEESNKVKLYYINNNRMNANNECRESCDKATKCVNELRVVQSELNTVKEY